MTDPPSYPIPRGLHATPLHLLDLRPTSEITVILSNPPPPTTQKNVFMFWHSGIGGLHPYTLRTLLTYHRRLSPLGWTIYLINRMPTSPLNISNFLNIHDPLLFPSAFSKNEISGIYAMQHTSDLIRFPLLLRYGGVYADVGMLPIGDLDALWEKTLGDPTSGYEVLSYADPGPDGKVGRSLTNYFLASRPENPFFLRCHRLLLKLWEGRTSTEGMHSHALLRGVPLMAAEGLSFQEEGRTVGSEEVGRRLTDYIIQGQVISLVMGLVDEEGGWDGPTYVKDHIFGIEFMVGSQLINELTSWDGQRQFELLSLHLTAEGSSETTDQKAAKGIVEECLGRSFGFKIATGFIVKVMGETLSSLWRKHEGSDDVPGTYAHWLRFGMVYWRQDSLPAPVQFEVREPFKRGGLLGEG